MPLRNFAGALSHFTGTSPADSPSPGLHSGEVADRGFRGLVLGLGPNNIAAGVNQAINATPSLDTRASRLQVTDAIASLFLITAFTIGRNNQLLSNNNVPCSAFSEKAVDSGIRGDVCTIGQQIAISVTNDSGAQLRFTGTVFGVCHDG